MNRKCRQLACEVITDPMMPRKEEHESFTCAHCGRNDRLKPMVIRGNIMSDEANEALAGRCTCCDKLICLGCVGRGCRPLERWLERLESRRAIVECSR